MTIKSHFMIKDSFDEYDYESSTENKYKTEINKQYRKNSLFSDYSQSQNGLIENINDKNYNIYENEIKYKIFEDISSVSKKDDCIELILNIPTENNIISINKIKLSEKLNKYIKDIFVCVGENKIIKKDDLKKKSFKIIEENTMDNIILCQTDIDVNLHILLDKRVINKIINKNIFINYSFAIFKNKIKFM